MASVFVKVSNIPFGIDEKELAISLHEHMDYQVKRKFLSCELDRQGELAVLEFEAGPLLNTWASLEKIVMNGKTLSVLNKDTDALQAPLVPSVRIPARDTTQSANVNDTVQSFSLPVNDTVESFSLPGKSIVQAISLPTSGILKSLANGTVTCTVSVPSNGVEMPNSPTIHEEMDVDEGVGSGESSPMPEAEGSEQPPVAVVNPLPVESPAPVVKTVSIVQPVSNIKPLPVSRKADAVVNGKVAKPSGSNGKSVKGQSVPKRSRVVPVTNHLVYFDLETTGLDLHTCEIVQIAASCGEKTYNVFMMPLKGVPPDASRINGLKVVGGKLLKNGKAVQVASPLEAWGGLINFLRDIGSVILVAHYGAKFDFHLLARDIKKHELATELRSIVTGCVDSILIFRYKLPGRTSYKQVDLANSYGISTAAAHDALGDVQVLSKLFLKVGVTAADIKSKRKPLTHYLW